ncbi:dipeptidyl peptidase III [Biscogniauxia marginata]|nr:dipeptidyl peptidase III [Biscogniauxia marginata]
MPTLENRGFHEVTHRLEVRKAFDSLVEDETKDDKLYRVYAHHLARACWYGSRIVLRQTSPEAEGIFDFILELHRGCSGRWEVLLDRGVKQENLDAWLKFAGMFLSSLGNYYDDGRRKAIPDVPKDALLKMASISPEATAKLEEILDPMMATQPANARYPGYPGKEWITDTEINAITDMIEAKLITSENTRLQKHTHNNTPEFKGLDMFEIIQASVEKDPMPQFLGGVEIEGQRQARVFLRRGDHSEELAKICAELTEASKHAATDEEKIALTLLVNSFRTGNYMDFNSALDTWIKDKAPLLEHCMGFLFSRRDAYDLRAEWQAEVGITHSGETRKVIQLVERSSEFICTLPYAVPNENNGKGPFELSEMDIVDFEIIDILASVSRTVSEATKVPVYDSNGKTHGVKIMAYGNRISLNSSPDYPCYYVHPSEAEAYMGCVHIMSFIEIIIRELIGYGTGKLLAETGPSEFNFDHKNPPISPVTGKPIQTWYRPEETCNSVFEELAPTVEECRAFLVSNYLADNKDILALFGYDQNSTLTADDLIYYTYLRIGVDGLGALRSFEVDNQTWIDEYDQALFVILKHILQDGDGVMWIEHDPVAKTLFVRVNRSKIISHGKPSIGRMLCKIHIWRSTADVDACRPFYEALSAVDGEYEIWRQIIASNTEPRWKFVQPNTFLADDGTVELREYEANNVGIIQSFFERNL